MKNRFQNLFTSSSYFMLFMTDRNLVLALRLWPRMMENRGFFEGKGGAYVSGCFDWG
jgi:hypothetical protein